MAIFFAAAAHTTNEPGARPRRRDTETDALVGGASLHQTSIIPGLTDASHTIVHPVAARGGVRFWEPDGNKRRQAGALRHGNQSRTQAADLP